MKLLITTLASPTSLFAVAQIPLFWVLALQTPTRTEGSSSILFFTTDYYTPVGPDNTIWIADSGAAATTAKPFREPLLWLPTLQILGYKSPIYALDHDPTIAVLPFRNSGCFVSIGVSYYIPQPTMIDLFQTDYRADGYEFLPTCQCASHFVGISSETRYRKFIACKDGNVSVCDDIL